MSKFVKPFKFLFPKQIRKMISFMPTKFPKKTLASMAVYLPDNGKKPVARVALLTGCVQKVLSPQINDATIRLLNRHGIEVVVPKKNRMLWFIKPSFRKGSSSKKNFYK